MTNKRLASQGWLAWLVCLPGLAVLSAACTAPQEAKSPEREPETVSEASEALDEAERDIRDLVIAGGDAEADDMRAAPPAPPPAAAGGSDVAQSRSTARNGDRCVTACRALSSMNRAKRRLCSLTGADDGRCQQAETRVGAARKLVQQTCPTCSA